MRRLSWLVGGCVALGSISACSIYGPDLMGTGGGSGGTSTTSTTTTASTGTGGTTSTGSTTSTTSSTTSTSSTSSTGTGGAGGSPACTIASECPGADTECQKRTCTGGVCGTSNTPSGTMLAAQTAGDCKLAICDGTGNIGSMPDNAD